MKLQFLSHSGDTPSVHWPRGLGPTTLSQQEVVLERAGLNYIELQYVCLHIFLNSTLVFVVLALSSLTLIYK